MSEAVKPATDNAVKAVETDASKKEKEAEKGALDKMKTEVADATKPGEAKKPEDEAKKTEEAAKKPEDAAKKPEEVAKKPEEVAKKPEEESLFNRIYDGVGNTVSALWNIRQPDKSADPKAIEALARPKVESVGYLDFGTAVIPGYDSSKVSKSLDPSVLSISLDTKPGLLATPADASKTAAGDSSVGDWFSNAWDSTKETFSAGFTWTKDTFSKIGEWTGSEMDKAFDYASNLDTDTYLKSFEGKSEYKVTPVTEADGSLSKYLLDYKDGSSMSFGKEMITRQYGDVTTNWNRETKEAFVTDKDSGGAYRKLADGSEVFTTKEGTQYIKRSNDHIDIIKKAADGSELRYKVEGKDVYQTFDAFKVTDRVGQVYRTAQDLRRGEIATNEVVTVDNAKMIEGTNQSRLSMDNEGRAIFASRDGGSIEFDLRQGRAVHKDKDGNITRSGTTAEMSALVQGLRVNQADNSITMEGCQRSLRYDAKTGAVISEMTDPATGKKIVTTLSSDGANQVVFSGANGEVLAQNKVNHQDLDNMFVEQNTKGETLSTFNYNDKEFYSADKSFKFTEFGTELFGGQVYFDSASGDIRYSDGVRMSTSSPGALQASEAAATSASVNATSVASQLSAKAGNPATISAGDLSQCYTAYGSISAALQQCLASGNFAGVGQCLAAQGALASAIGVIAPKLNAMEDARKAGLSGFALNEVGQGVGQGGGMSSYEAIQEIKARQNGGDRTVTT